MGAAGRWARPGRTDRRLRRARRRRRGVRARAPDHRPVPAGVRGQTDPGRREILRSGKRIRLVEVSLVQDDEPAVRGRALFLRRGVEPEQEIWHGEFTPAGRAEPPSPTARGCAVLHGRARLGLWDSQGRPADNKAPCRATVGCARSVRSSTTVRCRRSCGRDGRRRHQPNVELG